MWLGAAIAVHLLCVVWWIGGLAFVTGVSLPILRNVSDEKTRWEQFRQLEAHFESQVRVALILSGISGVFLLWGLKAWGLLSHPAYWWLDAMIGYWVLFVWLMFFANLDIMMQRLVRGGDPSSGWRRVHVLHSVLLLVALLIIAAAVEGSHGF